MAKITTGSTFKITAKMTQAARLMSEGKSVKDIAIILFNCVTDDGTLRRDEKKLQKAVKHIRAWQAQKAFQECYVAIIREMSMSAFGKAFATVTEQMDADNGWLANKAANDVMSRFGSAILGEESKAITVQIQGMPELGEPIGDGDTEALAAPAGHAESGQEDVEEEE